MHVDWDNADRDLLRVFSQKLESQVLVGARGAKEDLCVAEGDVEKDRGAMATSDVVLEFLLSVEKLQSNVLLLLTVGGIVKSESQTGNQIVWGGV